MINEFLLHWKARIGRLKTIAAIGLIIAIITTLIGAGMLNGALKNKNGPLEVGLTQLVNGEIAKNTYVTVSGYSTNETAYYSEENGVTTESYYYLVDRNSGDLILVEHYSAYLIAKKAGNVTITGMVRGLDSGIGKLVREDEVILKKEGLRTNSKLCIVDRATPPDLESSWVTLAIGVAILLISIVPFFFPSMVFVAHTLDTSDLAPQSRPRIRASGKFQKLTSLSPLEVGKQNQHFDHAVANIISNEEASSFTVYIHHIVRSKSYGVTVKTTKSDWGVFINADNVQTIEPGKIYAWKDEWAMRVQYLGPNAKTQILYISFENVNDLAGFTKLLKAKQFQISIPQSSEGAYD